MWQEVFGLALFTSLNPLLLAFILLVISRPRPVANLITFWLGCAIVNIPSMVIPLFVMNAVPTFATTAKDWATADPGSSVKPFQLITGVAALAIAVVMAVRHRMRTRVAQPVGDSTGRPAATLTIDPSAPDVRPAGRVKRTVAKIRAAAGRYSSRAHDAWENGALWVAFAFGLFYIPPPPLVLIVDTVLVASGAPLVTQVIGAVGFVLVMLWVLEVALLSYTVAPAKTQAVLLPVHEWSRVHRQLILLVLFTVVGMWQVITGLGLL